MVDDVTFNSEASGAEIDEGQLRDEIKLLSRHVAAGLLEEARGLCRGGELGVDCDEGGPSGKLGGKQR